MILGVDISFKEKVCAIYKVQSPSGRVYIGQTLNLFNRLCNYKNTNPVKQPILCQSFKKYGVKNHKFSIITRLPNDVKQIHLDNLECFYIEKYKSCNFKMMNVRDGGSRGAHSEATKEKMSNSKKGKKFSEKHIINLRIKNKERAATIEGKINCAKAGRANLGKKHSQESILKMRRNRSNFSVLAYDINGLLVGEYISQAECARQIGVSQPGVHLSIKKKIPNYKGLMLVKK